MPIYFDENSLAYEEIHGTAGHLEEMGYTCSVWKGGKKNHILQKIVLCDEKVDEIYRHLGRVPEKQMQQAQLAVLQELEKKSGLIGKIFRRFSDDMEDMDNDVILAEYGIYRTPNYVYVKGSGRLRIGTPEAYDIDLKSLRQGIGLSGEDLDGLEWKVDVSVKRIITIENLTTFFRWEEPDSVLIYLGGYHNAVRRKFLQKLYQVFPEAEYFHFGDIDVGGFEIYEDLCRRTGIPFTTYKIGISELEQYEQYTRELTENDRKRMDSLLNNEAYENVWPILRYMKEHGKKLEQESIL